MFTGTTNQPRRKLSWVTAVVATAVVVFLLSCSSLNSSKSLAVTQVAYSTTQNSSPIPFHAANSKNRHESPALQLQSSLTENKNYTNN